LSQDMYLAAAFILILSVLTLLGTLISDILLAVLDPRIRLEGRR
jgi:peptide/nickel transport system permease protein